ncbi:MAG: response regulator transcription factor, partial [Actinomycetia bacterium]|nr:response regulator transcription factor [Actinomycetes bacterium]
IDLVLLDVMMPRMSGYQVCRTIREQRSRDELPVIFLSAKNRDTDRVAGFEEGANDYLAKPIARSELLARVEAHLELLEVHRGQLEEDLVLRGLLPICCVCKKIRDDGGYWNQLEVYIHQHSEAEFSHGICPECLVERYPEHAGKL